MEKTNLTKELIIDSYKRSFVFNSLGINIFSIAYLTAFCLWFDDLLKFMVRYPLGLKTMWTILIFIPVSAILFAAHLVSMVLEYIRVLKGEFFITTDNVIKREKAGMRHRPKRADPHSLNFEKYGRFTLYRTYFKAKNKFVSSDEQMSSAYLDDCYYVAVLNKNKKIVAAYRTEEYYV